MEDEVMSEVHLGCSPNSASSILLFTISSSSSDLSSEKHQIAIEGNVIDSSSNDFPNSQSDVSNESQILVDENGDLIMPRKEKRLHCVNPHKNVVSIHHHLKTSIPYVGLQVWRGSLLLGDFLLHKMQTNELDDVVGLELGTGTGLVGILMAAKARLVFLTDFSIKILDNCHRNVILNSHRFNGRLETFRIRQLDWRDSWPPNITKTSRDALYSWREEDMGALELVSVIFAADVIYNDSITDAFFDMLGKLMPCRSKKRLWLALEKRYNFSISDLDVVAHGYHHFQLFLDDQTLIQEHRNDDNTCIFAGKKLQLDGIPQYILEYQRTDELELWEIWRK